MIDLRLEMPPKKQPRLEESDSAKSSTTCRGCQKALASLAYLKRHIDLPKTNCRKSYSDKEHQSMEQEIQEDKIAKKAQNYQKNKAKAAQNYQKNKTKAAQNYQKNKAKRSEWYQRTKEKLL